MTCCSAIQAATALLPSGTVQCNSFTGSAAFNSSAAILVLSVQFNCDSPGNYTLLQAYSAGLAGANITLSVARVQAHSPYPAGTFDLNVNNCTVVSRVPVAASAGALQDAINAANSSWDVVVATTGGNALTGYTWTLTFARPVGGVTVALNTSNVVAPGLTSSVKTLMPGDANSLFYDPIPLWMVREHVHILRLLCNSRLIPSIRPSML